MASIQPMDGSAAALGVSALTVNATVTTATLRLAPGSSASGVGLQIFGRGVPPIAYGRILRLRGT